jgi:hypothetical protein
LRIRDSQIDALARHLVEGLAARGSITPKADVKELVACIVELMSENFETEAQIEDEAEKMAEEQVRLNRSLDADRLRSMIKQRLADKRGFTI